MLKALNEQLKNMAYSAHDPFTDMIRGLVGPQLAPRYETNLRKMVLSLPAMLKQIRGWVEEADQSWEVKKLQSFALAYLYNPTDYLPEKNYGLFGYIDDAYIVGRVYEKSIEEIPQAGLSPMNDHDLSINRNIGTWLKLTQDLLPDETAQMDDMLNRYLYGNNKTAVRKSNSNRISS